MKKTVKIICIILCAAIVLTALYFIFAFFGNPISHLLARRSANQYMKANYDDTDLEIKRVGYNFKTGGYYAYVESPASQDSYFTIYMDSWGQYSYDTSENIANGSNTLSRLDAQYRELVKRKLPYLSQQFDVSIFFGELKEAGHWEIYSYKDESGTTRYYSLDKDYGLDRSELELDGQYDIMEFGRNYGHLVLYIHHPELSIEEATILLMDVKEFLDRHDVPFHGIDFHMCEPRNENGQNTGNEITLFDFLYSDFHDVMTTDLVQHHWDIAKEHYAIQDGLKNSQEYITSDLGKIIP